MSEHLQIAFDCGSRDSAQREGLSTDEEEGEEKGEGEGDRGSHHPSRSNQPYRLYPKNNDFIQSFLQWQLLVGYVSFFKNLAQKYEMKREKLFSNKYNSYAMHLKKHLSTSKGILNHIVQNRNANLEIVQKKCNNSNVIILK